MKLSAMKPIALVLSRSLWTTAPRSLGGGLGASFILFLSPGDPFSVLLEGQMSSDAAREGLREALGAPKAWYSQYLAWLFNILHGNFGTSIRTGLPVSGELLRVGLNTLILTIGSMLVTLL